MRTQNSTRTDESITPVDIINSMIDREWEDEEILAMLDTLWITQNIKTNSFSDTSLKVLFESMVHVEVDDNIFNPSHIIGLLIIKNKYNLTHSVLEITKVPFNRTFVQIAIESDWFDIVYLIKSLYPQNFTSNEKSYVSSLMLSFQRSNMFWLAKVHMLKSLLEHVNYINAESFLMYLLKSLAKQEPQNNVIYYAPNILLLSCNLIEICRIIVSKYALLGRLTDKVEKILIDITSVYIQDIEDEIQLRALAFEKDFENRDSLDLLSQHNINKIMNNKNMEQIALELWTSAFDVKGHILSTSSAYQICIYDSFNKPKDIVTEYFFLNWNNRSLNNFDHHLYQFKVWKTSMMAKFIVEGFFLTALTGIFQYYLLDATNSANTVNNSFATYGKQTDPSAQATKYAAFTTNAYSYYTSMQVTIYLSYIALTYPFKIILTIVFATKSRRSFKFINFTYILDIMIFWVFVIRIYLEFKYYESGLSSLTKTDDIGKAYYDNIFKYRDDKNLLSYLYTIGSSWLWLRIILLFRLTRFLGPLVKMIQNMIADITIFMVLFSLQLVVFATMGNLLFTSTSAYSTFFEALGTLFSSALGNFDFTYLSDNDKSATLGIVYLVLFIMLNNILLINLLIAILSNTYSQLEDTKLVLYILEILKLRSELEYDENCSALVSTFPPLNVVSLMFAPAILVTKNSKYINEFLFHIEYLPIMILLLALYIVLNALLIPVAYFKGIYVNLQQLWNNKIEISIYYRTMRFLLFLVFGLVILCLNLCTDIIVFVLHLYQTNISYRKIKENTITVTSNTYDLLQSKFEDEHRADNEVIDYKDVIIPLRNEMQVNEHLQVLIYGYSPSILAPVSQVQAMKQINEYSVAKNIIHSCCMKRNNQTVLYTEVMKCIMKDMKITAKLNELFEQWGENSKIKRSVKIEDNEKIMIENSSSSGNKMPYLKQFSFINLSEIDKAVKSSRKDNLSDEFAQLLKGIKEIVDDSIRQNMQNSSSKQYDALELNNNRGKASRNSSRNKHAFNNSKTRVNTDQFSENVMFRD